MPNYDVNAKTAFSHAKSSLQKVKFLEFSIKNTNQATLVFTKLCTIKMSPCISYLHHLSCYAASTTWRWQHCV